MTVRQIIFKMTLIVKIRFRYTTMRSKPNRYKKDNKSVVVYFTLNVSLIVVIRRSLSSLLDVYPNVKKISMVYLFGGFFNSLFKNKFMKIMLVILFRRRVFLVITI